MLSVSCDGLGCPVPVRSGSFGDPYGYGRGLGDGDGVATANANVKALQTALVAAGAKLTPTGKVDDATISALWGTLSADLPRATAIAKSLSSAAGEALSILVTPIQAINGIISEIPGLSVAKVLANWGTIDTLLNGIAAAASIAGSSCDACTTASDKLATMRTKVFADVASRATTLTSIVKAFSPTVKSTKTDFSKLKLSTAALNLIKSGAMARVYPVGTVQRYNTTRKVWVIYQPHAAGFGAALPLTATKPAVGNSLPPPPAGMVNPIITTSLTQVPHVPVATPGTEADVMPFYKKWWFWAIIGVGAAGGGYYYYRNKHAGAAK